MPPLTSSYNTMTKPKEQAERDKILLANTSSYPATRLFDMPSNTSIDVPGHTAYYAPATITSSPNTIQFSGTVGITASGACPSSYESQIHLALTNLRRVLVAAGATVSDIAKLTIYIVDYDAKQRVHTRHLQKFLSGHRTAITLVPVQQLAMPEWLIEIDAIAVVIPSPGRQLTNPGPQEWVDVVVVGAGLSGLSAARDITTAGLSCVVLEARDRVGGKTWSQPMKNGSGHGIIDLGAAWINDTNQSRMYALAKEFGAELIEQNTTGNCVLQAVDGKCSPFPYGSLPNFDAETQKHLAEVRDMVEAHCQQVDTFSPRSSELDSLTFDAYLRKNGASELAIATASIWTRAMLGQEPGEISALYFLNYCKSGGGLLQMRSDRKDGGQYLRVRQGTQYFSKELAKSLPGGTIELSSPVESVRQVKGGVQVTCPSRTIFARKVVLSVPTPVLKKIDISPPLPYGKQVLLESTVYGYYTKVMMVFKTPFWVDKGYCGLAQSFSGPASVIRDTSIPVDGKHVLTCFLVGDPGRAWAALPKDEQTATLLDQVSKLWMDGDRKSVEEQLLEIMGHEWITERYSGWGCPCTSLPPGVLDAVGSALRESVGDIYFVGTETAGDWKGYMEGAVRSGERGASEVINLLTKVSPKL